MPRGRVPLPGAQHDVHAGRDEGMGEHVPLVADQALEQGVEEPAVILAVLEEQLPSRRSLSDVVDGAGVVDASVCGHGETVRAQRVTDPDRTCAGFVSVYG